MNKKLKDGFVFSTALVSGFLLTKYTLSFGESVRNLFLGQKDKKTTKNILISLAVMYTSAMAIKKIKKINNSTI